MSYSEQLPATRASEKNVPNQKGVHFLVDVYGCGSDVLNDENWWKDILRKTLEGSGIEIVHCHFHRFQPHGLTGFYLLTSSHFSVHTWPEHDYAAIDLFTCSPENVTVPVIERLMHLLPSNEHTLKKMLRGFTSIPEQ